MVKKDILLVRDSEALDCKIADFSAFSSLSKVRINILQSLDSPKYPAEVARELKIPLQTVYYHFKALQQQNLVKLVSYKEKKGGIAKTFQRTSNAYALLLKDEWKSFTPGGKFSEPPSYLKFFFNYGSFDAKIIIGSPEPHGNYRARASDFCIAELGALIGRYGNFSYPLYYLDVEVNESIKKNSLFVLGGPKTNMLVDEINKHLKIRFEFPSFNIFSSISNKHYSENVGVIQSIINPYNANKKLFVIAGKDHNSTRTATLALLKKSSELEKNNLFNSDIFAKVVQGFDEDGDGIVDSVEILE